MQLINDAYNLVIDAMMGPDADCANLREPYPGILVTLKQIKIPIASVDVPSGRWSHKPWTSRPQAHKHKLDECPPGGSTTRTDLK